MLRRKAHEVALDVDPPASVITKCGYAFGAPSFYITQYSVFLKNGKSAPHLLLTCSSPARSAAASLAHSPGSNKMPTRSGADYSARLSIVDGKPCCRNGCPGGLPPGAPPNPPCECAPCPICDKRVPGWILTLKSPYMASGAWVGPHCVTCDADLFQRGMHVVQRF